MKRFLIIGALLVALCVPAAASAKVHAPPTAPCDEQHVMDLHINDAGVWFECVCEKLIMDVQCDWYELGPAPDASRAARRWNYVAPRSERSLMVQHRWPRFLATRRTVVVTGSSVGVTIPPAVSTSACSDPYLANDAWSQAHGC
jgi:hypothetical protein